jgi:hypothetical protein
MNAAEERAQAERSVAVFSGARSSLGLVEPNPWLDAPQAEDIIGAIQFRHAVDPPIGAASLRRGPDGVWEVHAEDQR